MPPASSLLFPVYKYARAKPVSQRCTAAATTLLKRGEIDYRKREGSCLQTSAMQMSRASLYKETGDAEKEEGSELKARKAAGIMRNLSPGESRLLDSWRLN